MSNTRIIHDISDSQSAGQNEDKRSVAVIGAGPAGLACAQTLLELGFKVDIYEMSGAVGGMARSCEILGQTVDLGPHGFHDNDPDVKRFFYSLVDDSQMLKCTRMSRILYKGKLFSYPLRGLEAMFKLGPLESARCIFSYARSAIFPRKDPTFEAWVSNAFGHRLYEIFFKNYSEKLWGIKCSELSDQFARERIKTLNLRRAVIGAFRAEPKRYAHFHLLLSTLNRVPVRCGIHVWHK